MLIRSGDVTQASELGVDVVPAAPDLGIVGEGSRCGECGLQDDVSSSAGGTVGVIDRLVSVPCGSNAIWAGGEQDTIACSLKNCALCQGS